MYTLKRKIRNQLQRWPTLYLSLLNMKRRGHWSSAWIVNGQTNLVIEGYPRSANSFYFSAFRLLHGKDMSIATHLHVSSQIVQATRLQIPTVVMLREPLQAAMSLKALDCQCHPESVEKWMQIPLHHYLEDYCEFYKPLIKLKGQFVVAPFHEVTEHIQPSIERINHMFNTTFIARNLTGSEKQQIFKEGGDHLSPSENRERIKDQIRSEKNQSATKHWHEKALAVYRFIENGEN